MYSLIKTPDSSLLILEVNIDGETYGFMKGSIFEYYPTDNRVHRILIQKISPEQIVYDAELVGSHMSREKKSVKDFSHDLIKMIKKYPFKNTSPTYTNQFIDIVLTSENKEKYGTVTKTTNDDYIPLPKIEPLISKNIINEKY